MSVAPGADAVVIDESAVTAVTGNAPLATKRMLLQALATQLPSHLYGSSVARQMRITEASLGPSALQSRQVQSRVVWEAVVGADMVDGSGFLDVGSLAYFLDMWASFPLIVLGVHEQRPGDKIGVSQSMQFTFHNGAKLGARVRGVATSLAIGNRVLSARCDVWDGSTGALICSGIHIKMKPQTRL